MSDTSTNKFNAQGDNAARAAFTPSPGTPTPTPEQGYTFWDTDDQVLYAWETGTGWVATSTATGNVNATGTLTQYAVVIGDGATDVAVVSGLGSAGEVLTSNGAGMAPTFQAAGSGGTTSIGVANGRLTTESGVPVSTSDRTAQATIYFTPYLGNQISLYNGAGWSLLTYTQLSLALSGLTSGKNYDVFVDYNSGTPQIVLSAAWSSDTARTDALALQDGISVKSGTPAYRWVGTIRTTATTTTEDSAAKRFVWNAYNQVRRELRNTIETANNWSYTTAAWRQANANTANQLDYVTGDIATHIDATCVHINTAGGGQVGIGVDVTNAFSGYTAQTNVSTGQSGTATYGGTPGLGRHFIAWLEYGGSGQTWYGDAGTPTSFQTGIRGSLFN